MAHALLILDDDALKRAAKVPEIRQMLPDLREAFKENVDCKGCSLTRRQLLKQARKKIAALGEDQKRRLKAALNADKITVYYQEAVPGGNGKKARVVSRTF